MLSGPIQNYLKSRSKSFVAIPSDPSPGMTWTFKCLAGSGLGTSGEVPMSSRRPPGGFNGQTNLAYLMLTFWSYSLASTTLSPWSQETCSSDDTDAEIRTNQDLQNDTRLLITDLLRTSSRSFPSLVSRQSLSRGCSFNDRK